MMISKTRRYSNEAKRGGYTGQGPEGRGQYDGLEEYCDLSTASEVFLIFTTQPYSLYAVVTQYFS